MIGTDGSVIGALIGVGGSLFAALLIVAVNLGGMRNEVKNLGERMSRVEQAIDRNGKQPTWRENPPD